MQLIVVQLVVTRCHWLDTLAIAWANQPAIYAGHIRARVLCRNATENGASHCSRSACQFLSIAGPPKADLLGIIENSDWGSENPPYLKTAKVVLGSPLITRVNRCNRLVSSVRHCERLRAFVPKLSAAKLTLQGNITRS